MTMQECYKVIGGNYEAVLGRLHSEALIQRFTLKFLEDQSYLQLKQAKQEQQKRESIMCGKYYINSKKNKIFCA